MRTEIQLLDEAAELIEKANANLQPELVTSDYARKLMQAYARIEKLGGFGVAALSRKLQDLSEVAKVAGTSMGKAKAVVTTGKVMKDSPDLEQAMTTGSVSLDQAAEIASVEQSAPGAAKELLQVASEHSFHVLRDTARATKLEAEQHKDLARRQHRSRSGRSYTDGLGMVNIHLTLEPHVGDPHRGQGRGRGAENRRGSQEGIEDRCLGERQQIAGNR